MPQSRAARQPGQKTSLRPAEAFCRLSYISLENARVDCQRCFRSRIHFARVFRHERLVPLAIMKGIKNAGRENRGCEAEFCENPREEEGSRLPQPMSLPNLSASARQEIGR